METEKKIIVSDPQEYFTFEGLRKRYNVPTLDIRTLDKMIEKGKFPNHLILFGKKVWTKQDILDFEETEKAKRFSQDRLAMAHKSETGKSPSKRTSA